MDAEEAEEAARQHARNFTWPEHYENETAETGRLLDVLILKKAVLQLERERQGYFDAKMGTPEEPETVVKHPQRRIPSLVDLTLSLRSAVIGQDAAVGAVAERVAASLAGLKLHPERPHAVFMLNGPSGTGKTTLAKQLALAAYGDENALIRVDMGDMLDSKDARLRLIGGSRIWKGSTPEGLLTTRILEKPRSVLLLDEIEKAHRDVHQLFLRAFDEGTLTDDHGQTADLSECIVVMTSNLAADADAQRPEDVFAPEFLGRVDLSVTFEQLSADTVREVAIREVEAAIHRLRFRGWWIEIDDVVPAWIAEHAGRTGVGARGVQQAVERLLLRQLVVFDQRAVRIGVREDGAALTFEEVEAFPSM